MSTSYTLPTSLCVGGRELEIRSDYRAALDICAALSDPGLTMFDKYDSMLTILYKEPEAIGDNVEEALRRATWFLNCGAEEQRDDRPRPKLMDWEQDFGLLVGAINRVAGTEVRALTYLHWWTFVSYYMEIGDCSFAQVVGIRNKKRKHKRLEKWEEEFYRDNRSTVDFQRRRISKADEDAMSSLFLANRQSTRRE